MTFTYRPSINVESCNLCGSSPDHWQLIATRDRAGYPATAVACRNCGLIFITPRMSATDYDEFYASGEYRRTVEKVLGRPHDPAAMHASQAKYGRSVCRWLNGKLEAGGNRLLDIGGSTGIVAEIVASHFGYENATVLDPAVDELAQASARGLKTELGSFEEWEPGGRQFDFVGLFQTTDHLLDIAGALRKVKSILAPDGNFVLDIVNVAVLLRGFRSVEHTIKVDHPYALLPEVMKAFLLRAGFQIVGYPGAAMEGRKIFFLCRHGEVVPDARPKPETVQGLFRLIEEVRNGKAIAATAHGS